MLKNAKGRTLKFGSAEPREFVNKREQDQLRHTALSAVFGNISDSDKEN